MRAPASVAAAVAAALPTAAAAEAQAQAEAEAEVWVAVRLIWRHHARWRCALAHHLPTGAVEVVRVFAVESDDLLDGAEAAEQLEHADAEAPDLRVLNTSFGA